ncbi:MAG: YheC/YheD family protein [Oscillospiraceae bacterium]|nr:YheC/YheD family protein [Oscillospiraceae bacterium]
MLIGYMHYRKSPAGLNRAYAFAAAAKAEGAELLYFSPGAVDFEKGTINGYQYADGKWENTVSPYPDVIYNTNSFSRDKQMDAAERLSQKVPFTSYSIGSKVTVYRNLTRYKKYADYLVPSEQISSAEQFFVFLEQYPEIVFKPSWGNKGMDVYYVKKEGGALRVRYGAEEARYDTAQAAEFVRSRLEQDDYIVQPYINCRTKTGVPYDFRLHVQKGHAGKWVNPIIYPRISSNGSIVCNIGQGGYTSDLTGFLQREFGAQHYDIRKYIELFSLQLAAHMDDIQQELYGEELNELGIDIGLDEAQRIFVYEVNWRPGHPPFTNINLSVIQNTIRYAMHLVRRAEGRDRNSEV